MKSQVLVLCVQYVIFLVRLQEEFEIDHSVLFHRRVTSG